MKINKAIFGVDNSYFLEFWPIQAKICKELLNIEPVLFYICDEDSDFYNDGYGLVKKVKKVGDVKTGLLACIVRMFGTKYFPNEVCLTCDLDMLMINKEYFINQIQNFNEDSLVIFTSDAYDLNRPEAIDLFKSYPFPFTQEMYNYPYNAAKGNVFNKILDTDCTFDEFVERHSNYKSGYAYMWMIDEFYFSDCVNHKNHGVEVNKLKRGYTSPWKADRRIDRHNFPVQLEHESEINAQIIDGIYDKQLLKEGYYIDVNCCRPYSRYKSAIDELIDIILIDNKKENNKKIDLENVFTSIYDHPTGWGSKESKSGVGSELNSTKRLRQELNFLFLKYKINSILDVPCGDFNWFSQMDLSDIKYVGGDIVKNLVEVNKTKFPNFEFFHIDITKDNLIQSDLVVTRDCFVHLSNDNILRAIDNIKNSGSRYLLTTSFTKFCENIDINDGEWREINLMIHPFNLKPIYLINEMCFESYPLATDKCMLLFDLKDLYNCKHENR
jgi:hypothetical protein